MLSYPTKTCPIHGHHSLINDYLLPGQQLAFEEFINKRNFLFLDFDGVMNSNRMYESFENRDDYFAWKAANRDEHGSPFDPESMRLLNLLIEEFDIDVIISSSWRNTLKKMQKLWKDRGLSGRVVGITDRSGHRLRGKEIKDFLVDNFNHYSFNWNWWEAAGYYNHHYDIVNQYVIIDDDSDMLFEHRNNFVKTNHDLGGFDEAAYHRARAIFLRKPEQTTLH